MLIDEFGFPPERVKVLLGGLPGWQKAGYPVEMTVAVEPKGKRFILWGQIKSKSPR